MTNQQNSITLYPSNWLYNAGVIGLLRVLEDYKVEKQITFSNSSVSIKINATIDEIFDVWDESFKDESFKKVFAKSYKGKKGGTQKFYYANQTENSIKERIKHLFGTTHNKKHGGKKEFSCFICGKKFFSTKTEEVSFTQRFSNILAGSEKTNPNSYWNYKSRDVVCPKCEFILMCHHAGLIRQFSLKSNTSEIFINAPSFKIMWYLNEYARKIYGKEEIKEVRQILGMSLIEMARKLNVQLSRWTKMNVEVVSKYRNKIDFFVLPYEIVEILSDREIASLLNDIGEFKVLNMVLDGRFDKILEFGERVMRIGLKLND